MVGARLSWDELWILMATAISSRGTCDRLMSGCVLVKSNKVIGAGYNGAVSGLENCADVGHLLIDNHCKRTIHDARNALNNTVASPKGATAYCVGTPCIDCVKDLLQNGIQRIVYAGSYDNGIGPDRIQELCAKKDVELSQWGNGDPSAVLIILQKLLQRLQGSGGLFRNLPNLCINIESEGGLKTLCEECDERDQT